MNNAINFLRPRYFLGLLSFLFVLVSIPITLRLTQQPKDVTKPQAKTETAEVNKPDKKLGSRYASNEILIKIKKEARNKLKNKENPSPEDTGIEKLNKLNKKYKVKKVEKMFSGPSAVEESSQLDLWYKIEFPVEKKVISENDPRLPEFAPDDYEEIDPQYGVIGKGLIKRTLGEYQNLSEIETVQPNYQLETQNIPNDYHYTSNNVYTFGNLWGLKNIQADQAWDTTTGSENIIVAVVDTGIDYNHPDLWNNMWVDPTLVADRNGDGKINLDDADLNGNKKIETTEYKSGLTGWKFMGSSSSGDPMDDYGHGTHCAGTIGASGNNDTISTEDTGKRIVGVNWKVKIMAVKFLDASGSGFTSDATLAWRYAAKNGARVISNSWGGSGSNPLLEEVARELQVQNIVNVAAAGNSSADAFYFSPANIPEVVTVAAMSHLDTLSCYSNYGIKVDVAAPGGDTGSCAGGVNDAIISARAITGGNNMCTVEKGNIVDNYYCRVRGTSMATPHVAGLAALILSLHPDFTPEEVRSVLRTTSDRVTGVYPDPKIGYGRINAKNAVAVVNPPAIAKITSPYSRNMLGPIITERMGLPVYGTASSRNGFSKYELQIAKYQDKTGGQTNILQMNKDRTYHTAVSLPNGKIFIAGGGGIDSVYHQTTELYDPATNTFALGPNMSVPRYYHAATLLPNGKILLSGGYAVYFSKNQKTADLYDPQTNTILPAGSMFKERAEHTATLLPSGKVVVIGGNWSSYNIPTNTIEIYDPNTNSFTLGPNLTTARSKHTATLLSNGKIFIAGGITDIYTNNINNITETTEIYDPATNTISAGPNLDTKRSNHVSALLPDNTVIIIGGVYKTPGTTAAVNSSVYYNPATNQITTGPNMNKINGKPSVNLLPNGNLIFFGGGYPIVELYDYQKKIFINQSNMNYSKYGQTSTLIDQGKVLVAGGITNGQTKTAEIYPLNNTEGSFYNWRTVYTGNSPVSNAKLGDIPAGLTSGNYYLHLIVTDNSGVYTDRSLFTVDNDVMSGWPRSSSALISMSRDLADLNGDGTDEIIHNTGYSLEAYHIDGSMVSGFPVYVPEGIGVYFEFWESTIFDLDNDGKEEIIINLGKGILVVKGDGTFMPGWPVQLALSNDGWVSSIGSTVAVGDTTGDGKPEIFMTAKGMITKTIYTFAYDLRGNLLSGWPIKKEGRHDNMHFFYSEHMNSLIDLDGDKILDLVSTSRMSPFVYAWHGNGKPVAGWPFDTKHNGAANLTVGYSREYGPIVSFYAFGQVFDPANYDHIWYCSQTDGYPCHLHILRGNATSLPNWPLLQVNTLAGGGKLADLDGDGELELFRGEASNLSSYELDKSKSTMYINNFGNGSFQTVRINNINPLAIVAYAKYLNYENLYEYSLRLYEYPGLIYSWEKPYGKVPTVSDIDNDGILEILSYSYGNLWIWKVPNALHKKTEPEWTVTMHDANNSNNGTFVNNLPSIVTPTPSGPTNFPIPTSTITPKPGITPTPTTFPSPPPPTVPPTVTPTPTIPSSDTLGPYLTIVSPPNGYTVSPKGTLKINTTQSDPSGIYKTEISMNNLLLKSCLSTSTCSVNYPVSKIPPGFYTIKATSWDNSPLKNSSSQLVNITRR